MGGLDGKVALITGGTSGIGAAPRPAGRRSRGVRRRGSEVARVVIYLAGDATFTTGAELFVDGGLVDIRRRVTAQGSAAPEFAVSPRGFAAGLAVAYEAEHGKRAFFFPPS